MAPPIHLSRRFLNNNNDLVRVHTVDVCDVIYFNQYCGSVLFCLVEFFYVSSFYNPIREQFQFVLSLCKYTIY